MHPHLYSFIPNETSKHQNNKIPRLHQNAIASNSENHLRTWAALRPSQISIFLCIRRPVLLCTENDKNALIIYLTFASPPFPSQLSMASPTFSPPHPYLPCKPSSETLRLPFLSHRILQQLLQPSSCSCFSSSMFA